MKVSESMMSKLSVAERALLFTVMGCSNKPMAVGDYAETIGWSRRYTSMIFRSLAQKGAVTWQQRGWYREYTVNRSTLSAS